jgi:hypothetical protein
LDSEVKILFLFDGKIKYDISLRENGECVLKGKKIILPSLT